jgi:hypothetical protein
VIHHIIKRKTYKVDTIRKRSHYSSNRNNNGGQGNGQGGQGNNNHQNRNRMRRSHNGQNNNNNQNRGVLMMDGEAINPRQRHNAKNNRDKYLNQARDMMSMGDRVKAEYYFQHADHYQRILNLIEEQHATHQREQGVDTDDRGASEHEDMAGDMMHAMPSPSEVYADAGFAPQSSNDTQDDKEDHRMDRSSYDDRDYDAPRPPRRQYQQSQPRTHQRQEREPRAMPAQADMLADAESHAPVREAREPREPRVERAPRAPRQPRVDAVEGDEPRVQQPRQPRQPRTARVRPDADALDDASNHGSQLEALLPAPKNIQ